MNILVMIFSVMIQVTNKNTKNTKLQPKTQPKMNPKKTQIYLTTKYE